MVALDYSDLYSHRSSASVGEYVWALGDWPMGREAVRIGKIRRLLDSHGGRGRGGELPDCYSRFSSGTADKLSDQEPRLPVGRSIRSFVRTDRRPLCFWIKVSARTARRVHTRVA